MAKAIKLYYFELPGRAEATRIMLHYGGIPFEDYRFPREQWPTLKPQMPFGQVPVLEVDGVKLAQTVAIEFYVAGLAGLLPADPLQAAKTQELAQYISEIGDTFRPTHAIQDPQDKIKARQDIVAGPLKERLNKLSSILEANGGKYFVGGALSYADISVFASLSMLISGFLDGVPKDLLDSYPALKAHHNLVAAVPSIAAQYKDVTEGLRLAYKPVA